MFAHLLTASVAALAPAPARITVVDLVPNFLRFQAAAQQVEDPEERFRLWQTLDGVAAVPPGPVGVPAARRMLDQAWPRYANILPALDQGIPLQSEAVEALGKVNLILGAPPSGPITVRGFVGMFDGNAFTYAVAGNPVVSIPVEAGAERRRRQLVHELTHAVHIRLAGLSGGWSRTIGATVVEEGLAMHVVRAAYPDLPIEECVGGRPGWWARAQALHAPILRDVVESADASDGAIVYRFTAGTGPSGIEREAYAAGWWIVDRLLERGMTLGQIARVPEAALPALMRSAAPASSNSPAPIHER